jgi:hypothetical protein
MTRPGRLLILALLACAGPLLGWSCDRGTLTIHVVRSPDTVDDPLPDPPTVAKIRVRVEGGGMGIVERTFPYHGAGSKIDLPEIPVGDGRVVTIEGLAEGTDGNDSVYSRGSSIPLEIRPGNNYIKLFVGRVQHFSRTPEDMREARGFHAAVVLADGRVVLVGGATAITRSSDESLTILGALGSAEVLDATSASFDIIALDCSVARPRDCLARPRALATATALSTGVLVAGGEDEEGPLASAELYDTTSRLFLPGGILTTARSRHAAVALGDGATLFGGRTDDGPTGSSEAFDGKSFHAGAAITPRESATATLLPDPYGGVLVVGGRDASKTEVAIAELVTDGGVEVVGSLSQARAFHTATLIEGGRVLILGGFADGAAVNLGEVYDPSTKTFAPVEKTEETLEKRWAHAAVTMSDGRVLVTGGFSGGPFGVFGGARRDAEILDPSSLQMGSSAWSGLGVSNLGAGSMTRGRAGHSASLLANGLILIAGGVEAGDVAVSTAEVFVPQR